MRTRDQLKSFAKALRIYSGIKYEPFIDWVEAFDALEDYLSILPNDRRKVVFIDEMSWIDTKRSDFVSALENFWNGWASGQYDIVLVATGSATSWMTDKLLMNRGGLHNRIRHRIYLKPFTLKETEEYLKSQGMYWDRYQILQAYMFTGGVPLYLKLLSPKLSVAQNLDALCFSETGAFLTRVLPNLERCNFIDQTSLFKNQRIEFVYRLIDFYTLFYFKFIADNKSKDEQWWTHHLDSSSIYSWMGTTFETICMLHHNQIKKRWAFPVW